jgi:small conductance mechanosensitive channel
MLTSYSYPEFRDFFWESFSQYFTPSILIFITLIIISILSQVIHRFFRYLRIALKKRPGTILKSETTRFVELLLVYLVYIIGMTIILIIALGMVGLSDEIWNSLVNFFENNFAPILLVMIGLVIIYAISKFITAFISDLKSQSTKYNPNTLELGRNMANYILLIIAILLVLFSIFSFTGLTDIGETLLTTIIIVVGLVLAMSASGTLGNFFAGLVLIFTSPFESGDTVKIGNGLVGKVQSKALFATKIQTNDGEEIQIANAKLLESQIINYSAIPKSPIVVDIKVNYEVTSEQVHNLLKTAAEKTEGIDIDEQPPKVYTKKFEANSIKYRLSVHLDRAGYRNEVNSELLENIQKTFNEAGIKFSG